ncbi:hypothetical protein D3C86_1417170 [compost metagenome]
MVVVIEQGNTIGDFAYTPTDKRNLPVNVALGLFVGHNTAQELVERREGIWSTQLNMQRSTFNCGFEKVGVDVRFVRRPLTVCIADHHCSGVGNAFRIHIEKVAQRFFDDVDVTGLGTQVRPNTVIDGEVEIR